MDCPQCKGDGFVRQLGKQLCAECEGNGTVCSKCFAPSEGDLCEDCFMRSMPPIEYVSTRTVMVALGLLALLVVILYHLC